MTASKELLEKLHDVVGTKLLERIETGEASASDFAQAIKFLSDNNIEAIPEDNTALRNLNNTLTKKLPFSNEDSPIQ